MGKTGELIGTLFTIADVTDRKQTEDALRASQALFESFMNHSPVTAFIKDSTGRYVYVNQVMEHLFHRKQADWLGKTDFDIFPPYAAQQWRNNDVVVLTTATMMQTLETVPYDDGEHYYMSFKFPVTDVSGQRLLGGVSIDITELKQLEAERNRLLVQEQTARAEAEKANRLKDEFLAIVSHELRTPLTAILGWIGMLQTGMLDSERATLALETIERNANLQMQLIEDLLDVSRIIRGELSLNYDWVDLVGAIAAAIEVVQPAADAKAIQLESVLDTSVEPIWGDSDRVQQVVLNLFSNAIKFTPNCGRVEVRLSKEGSGESASYAQIQVSDTGKGISADFLPYVFDRFRQADSTSTRSNKGLGLGLAIASHLVELHGGTIGAQSQGIGQGATFTVKLPIPIQKKEKKDISLEEEKSSLGSKFLSCGSCPASLNGLQVLVVDDETDVREWITTVLTECGAQVIAVGSVGEALAALEQFRPDVLVSDIGMPNEDGYTFIRKVRELEQNQGDRIEYARSVILTCFSSSCCCNHPPRCSWWLQTDSTRRPNDNDWSFDYCNNW
ncbi:hypothetical protein WA1_23215 [Scytonema hofmannii PCC 7110]|uniref:Circadian input-output histidine kinase CikA n=1 Tax=Scytonema hofmannii PCC 7110 TaxID=128403 RepID=A0A139X8S6_9CYAN|nr:ATP-binding protein [Scytonema hofmannii]KYC41033.1 hypothetical protein WA1_23215 [Scytonema hofmannii PCC 7110]